MQTVEGAQLSINAVGVAQFLVPIREVW